ncbi:transcription antitermination factor NusB [Virgibacillus dakarensis]|uniref:Transcription antitermination protein NusB n=1 Tax=Lentibacillus populi TaxID=1827502 RepID=A0A9W5X4J8_9BACI|nr:MULTISPECIES: transcription antitermination factor NusB [Bacillaceae]MTW85113.1 transcription antitermination factor NusB [Virgibacillus dakarensis]GGB34670.1 N utilization substance protein B [Lentibacillus populi]
MKRHAAREKAFQILFQLDMNEFDPAKTTEEYVDSEDTDEFLRMLVQGVRDHKAEIDSTISGHMEKWSLARIATVERTILRIATYEITYLDDIPVNVSINEAVELANTYGDHKSGKFVNGVLSRITRK